MQNKITIPMHAKIPRKAMIWLIISSPIIADSPHVFLPFICTTAMIGTTAWTRPTTPRTILMVTPDVMIMDEMIARRPPNKESKRITRVQTSLYVGAFSVCLFSSFSSSLLYRPSPYRRTSSSAATSSPSLAALIAKWARQSQSAPTARSQRPPRETSMETATLRLRARPAES